MQDFTPIVQEAVNRIQSEDETRALFDEARRLGFGSINIDLIYGLPFQTRESFAGTLDTVIDMRPDRVAVYSYAHVPWIRGNQKRIDPTDLPPAGRKIELFVEAMSRFVAAGYRQIGMDHFALPDDELARASVAGTAASELHGLHDAPGARHGGGGRLGHRRRARRLRAERQEAVDLLPGASMRDGFPIERGYVLDADDHLRRHVITTLMCNFQVDVAADRGAARDPLRRLLRPRVVGAPPTAPPG